MSIRELREKNLKIDSTVFISHTATIIGDVEIKREGSIWPNVVIRGDSQSIRIGSKVNIQDNVVIHTEFNKGVIIGDNVSIGHSAIIHGCQIGNNVVIGMGAIILDNARIDDWVLIGAGAVVTQESHIPSKSLALGVPCKVVRELNESDLKYISTNAEEYVKLSRQYIKQYSESLHFNHTL